jgi:hypothetical protein
MEATTASIWSANVKERMFQGPPALRVPYLAGPRRGSVRVFCGTVPDLLESGADALVGEGIHSHPSEEKAQLAGFPALLATVEPQARGYQNWMGWIQCVGEKDLAGNVVTREDDPIWFLRGRDVPYAAVGYAPSFFDAPTRPARPEMVWEADLFLCSLPLLAEGGAVANNPVRPLVGIRWGFRIPARGGAPETLPPKMAPPEAWTSWVPVLRGKFPTWRFADTL